VERRFKEKMPKGFVNDVRGWSFTRFEVEEAAKEGKLLTMDIDMDGLGVCSLNCGHCFRRNKEFYKEKRMGREELFRHLAEAKKLGLKTVKLIGPGEPLEEPGLITFLERLNCLGITALIFTKGRIIGDDATCMSIHKKEDGTGMDGKELTAKLKELNVSILLGTTSFDPEIEDRTVGKVGYHTARNEAIMRLVKAGFNEYIPGQPTRLAFVCTPVTPANISEVFELYKWARERHIQPAIAPTMIAGRALDKLSEIVPQREELVQLYTKIIVWAIDHGVMTLEELKKHGVAAYAGGAPCNQIAVGVFLRGDGKVLRCPGDDITIVGDLKEKSLTEIWNESENRKKYAGQYNNGCPPKEGKSFPDGFFKDVMKNVVEYYSAHCMPKANFKIEEEA
jgi:MoaA/NifB/PqqE/SkfB family radical SAM enzyme